MTMTFVRFLRYLLETINNLVTGLTECADLIVIAFLYFDESKKVNLELSLGLMMRLF